MDLRKPSLVVRRWAIAWRRRQAIAEHVRHDDEILAGI
jgi:hypothetical protein